MNNKQRQYQSSAYWILMTVILVIMYLLNRFTPLLYDDWVYVFRYDTNERINSLSDIFISQYYHYFGKNGRVIPHIIIQMFDGYIGKGWFNVFNAVVFVVFLHLVVINTTKDKTKHYYIATLAFVILFFLIPSFNEVFLWMSGSCNYTLSACLVLLFNYILMNGSHCKPWMYPLLFLFGIICGWTHEALVVGMLAGYFFYFIFNWKKLTSRRAVMLIGFFIGTALVCLAPSAVNRAINEKAVAFIDINNIVWVLAGQIVNLSILRIFYLMIIMVVVLLIKKRKKIADVLHENFIFIVALFFSLLFVQITNHQSGRSRFGVELFSLLIVLNLIKTWKFKPQILHIANLLTFAVAVYVIILSYMNFNNYKEEMHQITNSKNENVIVGTNGLVGNSLTDRWIVYYNSYIWNPRSCSYGDFPDKAIFFGKKKTIFLPKEWLKDVTENPQRYEKRFNTFPELPFYALKIDKGTKVKKITYELNPVDKKTIPFYIRPFTGRFMRYTAERIETGQDEWFVVDDVYGDSYLIVAKNMAVDERLKGIKLNRLK